MQINSSTCSQISSLSEGLQQLSLDFTPPFSHSLELHSLCEFLHAAALEPLGKILALTDVKCFELVATVNNSLDANPSNSNTTSNR